ncbi:MAG: hypothetical protein IMY72_00415 [Bacteroidetes bacterium]|nr:hypothetical protein [Bacteroidota bacterium]
MKKILSILFIISFLACSKSKEKKEVPIFNNISFKLFESEKIVDIKNQITNNYQSYFTNSNIQIPLFKCVKNKDYTIYLSIPYNTSIEELTKFQIFGKTLGQKELQTDTLSYFFKKQYIDTAYISEYSKIFDENLIYILAITNSKIISDSLFNNTELSTRLIQK